MPVCRGWDCQQTTSKFNSIYIDAHIEYPVKDRTDELELEEHNSGFLSYVRGTQHIVLYEFTIIYSVGLNWSSQVLERWREHASQLIICLQPANELFYMI